MKKIFSKEIFLLPLFLVITLFVSVNKVSADTSMLEVGYNVGAGATVPNGAYSETKSFLETYSSVINNMVTDFMDQYEDYSSSYPYYYISLFLVFSPSDTSVQNIQLNFYANSALPIIPYNQSYLLPYELSGNKSYNIASSSLSFDNNLSISSGSSTFYTATASTHYLYANHYFFSNFDLRFIGLPNTITSIGYEVDSYNRGWLTDALAPIPTYYDYLQLSFLSEYDSNQYTEVNLNNYAYVILSFKDYINLYSPTQFDVIGNFCLTSAYDYGLTPKEVVTDICSPHYTSFTPTYVYTTSSDLSRGIIYYLKALDTSYDNKIKINTGIYNITYITSDNQYNPVIYVNGRPYSPTPYNELPSTSIINTENGYIPGQTCAVGDPDCLYSNSGIDIDNLFTHPLQLLQSLWGSITQFFTIVQSFILVLPIELQTFLYVAFMLAVILGIIKIVL